MERWEQQIKEQVNTSISKTAARRIDETLHTLPRQRRPFIKYSAAAAAVLFSTMLGSSYISPALANTFKEIPVIGSAFEYVGSIGVQQGVQQGLPLAINESVLADGGKLTFTESMFDGSQIYIAYELTSKDHHLPDDLTFTLDGESAGTTSWYEFGEYINEDTYAGSVTVMIEQEDHMLGDSFVLGMESSSFELDIPVEKAGEITSAESGIQLEKEGVTITYEEILLYPTSTQLNIVAEIDETVAKSDDRYEYLQFLVTDDKGRIISLQNGAASRHTNEGKIEYSITNFLEPLSEDTESLILTPYVPDLSTNAHYSEYKSEWNNQPLIFEEEAAGMITIIDVEKSGKYTLITYQAETNHLLYETPLIWLESGNERIYSPQNPILTDLETRKYQLKFPGDIAGPVAVGLNFQTDNEFLEELAAEIVIK
ncbi:DUF4179 domain-containing protein [Evansella clarkii]|uniref:DUF4179 domain-containing protein n=1 Tax=Evansella clarkii TaxID=79879 RepID=UPI0009988205|nr:DUF4179 domain-containing protein [Evansella clarkii]